MSRWYTSALLGLCFISASIAVGNDLGSCVDAQCPLAPGTKTQAACHIYNQTLNAIGVATYEVPLPNLDPVVTNSSDSVPTDNIWSGSSTNATLSWTVGVSNFHHLVNSSSPDLRHIDRIYYLSSPPTLDLTNSNLTYAGCALYMTGEDSGSVFYDAAANQRSKHSYCRTLLGYSCHDSIKASAQSFAQRLMDDNGPTASVAQSCADMAAYVQSTLSTSCPNLDPITSVTGIALTGPDAETPITTEQNATSDCYPTSLKQNKLTRSFSYNVTALAYTSEAYPALLGETPLWSVFYSLSNEISGGVVAAGLEEPDVQLLCLRPVDENMLNMQVAASTVAEEQIRSVTTASGATSIAVQGIELGLWSLIMAFAMALL